MLVRLDAKHTFIICNLSFRGAEKKKEQMVRGDMGGWDRETRHCVKTKTSLSHSRHEKQIPPYVASVLSAHCRL